MSNPNLGSTFDDCASRATKRVLVRDHAIAAFGDQTKAMRWLATPLQILEGSTPLQVMSMPGGIEVIDTILTRIDHNIPF